MTFLHGLGLLFKQGVGRKHQELRFESVSELSAHIEEAKTEIAAASLEFVGLKAIRSK